MWSGMSPPGRGQFLNPHPGEPREDTDESLYDQACLLHSTSPGIPSAKQSCMEFISDW